MIINSKDYPLLSYYSNDNDREKSSQNLFSPNPVHKEFNTVFYPEYKLLKTQDDPFIHQLRDFSDKKFKTLFYSQIENFEKVSRAIYVFNQARIFLKLAVNKDIVFNHMKNSLDNKTDMNTIVPKAKIEFFMKLYNNDRVLTLVFKEDNGLEFINDFLNEAKKEKIEDLKKMIPKQPKTFRDIHDYFFNEKRVKDILDAPDYNINPREDFLKLNNSIINFEDKQLRLFIPQTRHELAKFSLKSVFDNCVGVSDLYSERVLNAQSTIIGLFENNKPLYCIETKKYNFLQARGVSNQDIPKDIFFKLQELICLKPTLPNEFIEVENSFIFGYRYNPQTLEFYVMFRKNEQVYVYFDVPFDVYEKFQTEESKGRVLNHYIKKYEFSKIPA